MSHPASNKTGCSVLIRSLSVAFRTRQSILPVLHKINLAAEPGEVVSVIGPSGSGKSTLLRALCDLVAPLEGEVLVNGVPPSKARTSYWVGLVPQRPTLMPNRTVEENIRLPLEVTGSPTSMSIDEVLELVQLRDFRSLYPVELSGGMQQRTALARALVTRPKLLLMDEPFSALDELLREDLQIEFSRIQRSLGQTIVFVTHSVEEAVFLSDKIVVLTPLPGTVKNIIPLERGITRDRGYRDQEIFFESVKRVRGLIQK